MKNVQKIDPLLAKNVVQVAITLKYVRKSFVPKMIYRHAKSGAVMIVIEEFHHLFYQNYDTACVTSLAVMVQEEYIGIETIVVMTSHNWYIGWHYYLPNTTLLIPDTTTTYNKTF